MENLNDFELREKVEFEIDGKKFVYKPADAGDELDWSDEYIEKDKHGVAKQNLKKLTLCKFRNFIEFPYDQEVIEKVIGEKKDWKDLSNEEKEVFCGKIKPSVFNKIVVKINEIDSSNDSKAKKK